MHKAKTKLIILKNAFEKYGISLYRFHEKFFDERAK